MTVMVKTICVSCNHHHTNQDGPRSDCWYNHFCLHPELAAIPEQNPVTGKVEYAGVNSLWGQYFTAQKHPYCRDVNNGNCPHYESEEQVWT